MQPIFQLIYRSRATRAFSQSELDHLLAKARKTNVENNITGILFYGNGYFIQVLEGDENIVNDLYYKLILSDPRHYLAQVIFTQKLEKRSYPSWTMGFKALETEEMEQLVDHANVKAISKEMDELHGLMLAMLDFSQLTKKSGPE
jgi:hypothetical protein